MPAMIRATISPRNHRDHPGENMGTCSVGLRAYIHPPDVFAASNQPENRVAIVRFLGVIATPFIVVFVPER